MDQVRGPRSGMRLSSCLVLVVIAGACRSSSHTSTDQTATPVRMATPPAAASCAEWVQRAQSTPNLDVEKVPEPIAFDPPPIPKTIPAGATGKTGRAEVRIRVLVDTLGRADMTTFTVLKSTSRYLSQHVRVAVAKWKFRPAEVGGCKVPRNYNWAAVQSPPRKTS
jgi:outer membrane biosynthesis protein TonB